MLQSPLLCPHPSLMCDQALPCLSVSEFQEEGMNAINLPLSPISFELDPEDTMLGNCPLVLDRLSAHHLDTSTKLLFFFLALVLVLGLFF